jgi:hypothetical protein
VLSFDVSVFAVFEVDHCISFPPPLQVEEAVAVLQAHQAKQAASQVKKE